MEANFQRSLAAVLKHEGGYVDHPADPGVAGRIALSHEEAFLWSAARNGRYNQLEITPEVLR